MLLFSLNFFFSKNYYTLNKKVKDKKYIKLSKNIPRQSIVTHIPLLAAGG